MAIDQSLAKGLAASFLKNWQSKIEEKYKILLKVLSKIDITKRSNFDKFRRLHREAFKDTSMTFSYGGSKRNPYIANVTMFPNKGRHYGYWDENALGGIVELEWIKDFARDNKFRPLGFFVGEHALARIYQRSFNQLEDGVIDPFKITEQLRLVPLWTAFWVQLIILVGEYMKEDICLIEPFIPTADGLLLCKTSDIPIDARLRMIEIRTYINKSHFDPKQEYAHQIMLDASQKLEESILAIYPYEDDVDENQKFISFILFNLLLHRVIEHIDEISDMVLSRRGDFKNYKFSEAVKSIYSTRKSTLVNTLDVFLKQGGTVNEITSFLIKNERDNKHKDIL